MAHRFESELEEEVWREKELGAAIAGKRVPNADEHSNLTRFGLGTHNCTLAPISPHTLLGSVFFPSLSPKKPDRSLDLSNHTPFILAKLITDRFYQHFLMYIY